MNFLKETITAIKESGHTPEDIIFIGSERSGHSCSWEEFQSLANVEYNNGFGLQEVASDLIIAFADGQILWRDEYHGAESWEFRAPFKMPTETKPIQRLIGRPFYEEIILESLNDLHDSEKGE